MDSGCLGSRGAVRRSVSPGGHSGAQTPQNKRRHLCEKTSLPSAPVSCWVAQVAGLLRWGRGHKQQPPRACQVIMH